MKPQTANSGRSVSPARAAAFDILLRVEQQDAYAGELLHSAQYEKLSAVDHGLATELVMGVLRWRPSLDRTITQASSQALGKLDVEVLTALRLGAYQLHYLERIPSRAAVHESVELVKRARKRSAAPFVNAVLRKLARQSATVERAADSAESLAERYAHPLWLVRRWVQAYGLETAGRICAYDQQAPGKAIRLRSAAAEEELRKEKIELAPGVLLASSRRVQSGDVVRSRAFREGLIGIQDEASQLVAALVGKGASILDCCAAPGGKTCAVSDANPSAKVIAVEVHPHRARLLRKLVRAENVCVVAADIRSIPLLGKFDRVLADVPCSGTGTMARNPEIKWKLRPEDLTDLQARQLAILQAAMTQVAAGGRLVYSTCSLEKEENSEVVERVLASHSDFRLLDCRQELERLKANGELVWPDPGTLVAGPYLRTLPGVHDCEGFFAAVLEKRR